MTEDMMDYPHYRHPGLPDMVYVTEDTWREIMARIEQLESREKAWEDDPNPHISPDELNVLRGIHGNPGYFLDYFDDPAQAEYRHLSEQAFPHYVDDPDLRAEAEEHSREETAGWED